MERFRLRRSDFTAFSADHSSSSFRFQEGNRQVEKQRKVSNLAFDYSSCSSTTTEEDSFPCEFGSRYSKQTAGTPIKKLLAEEMSRETESRRRSPSVIARLMGLDGLPTQQPSLKQQKKISENQLQRMAASEKGQRNGKSYSHGSSRKSSKDEQEFKDVFEVLDVSKMDSCSYSSRGTANSIISEDEMAFIQQRFMEAKRLSTDENLQDSKEFRDAIEDLDSNQDLLLKFLQQPDSMFTRHLHDLQGAPPQTRCGRISAMKSSNSADYESFSGGCKMDRNITYKSRRKHHDDVFRHSYSKHTVPNPLESSNIRIEGKDMPTAIPTRIVVLKPNIGKVQNTTRTVTSPRSSHDFLKHSDNQPIKNRESDLCGNVKFPDDVGCSRYKSREIAKEITKQMRKSLSNGSMNFSAPGFREYAGDDSSSNESANESANESEVTTGTSRTSIDWSNRYRPSSSHSTETTVSSEARKRLSERWKMTHKSMDMGIFGRSSTLGEMLAIPDRVVRSPKSDAMICERGFRDKVDGNNGPGGWIEPLGISSKDGWKDGCIRNLPRSRSIPSSSTATGSPKIGTRRETFCSEKYMMPKESVHWERNNALKGKIYYEEGSSSKNLRSRYKKSHISPRYKKSHSDASPDILFSKDETQSIITKGNQSEQSPMISKISSVVIDANLFPENMADAAIENAAMPTKTTDPYSSAYVLVKGDSSASDLDLSSSKDRVAQPKENSVSMHQPITDHESSAGSSKDADQPSPVSVLETPFPDDLSSGPECFSSLSADLHGLRMQLQLLKMESGAYGEGHVHITSDENVEKGSVGISEAKEILEESKELSYIVDLLLDAGIEETDPDAFVTTWYSSECPVNPLLFEQLEKKYCNHSSWPRSERRLLFDRVNSAILIIYQQFADPHPWVRPATGIASRWIKNRLEDSLRKLLASQDRNTDDIAAGNARGRESQWLDLGEWLDWGEDIDVIGREIEKVLMEDLANELVGM